MKGELAREPLGAGDRRGRPCADPGVALEVLGDRGLLEEQEPVGLQHACDLERGRRVVNGVAVIHDVDVVAEREAQLLVLLVDRAQLRTRDARTGRDPRGDVGLHAVEALGDPPLRVPDPFLRRRPVEVRVHRHACLARTAQQCAHGDAEQLSLEVPERLVDPADGAGEHDAAGPVAGAAVRIQVEVDLLDLERIAPDDVFPEVPDHLRDHGFLATVGGFANATDALVGEDPDVGPLATVVGLHELDGHVGDLHRVALRGRSAQS
jgi:hypothetical protein